MDLVFLVMGFIALIVLVYLFYNLAASENPLKTNLDRYAVSLTLVRQRFIRVGRCCFDIFEPFGNRFYCFYQFKCNCTCHLF